MKLKYLLGCLAISVSLNVQASSFWEDVKKDAQKAWDDTKENASKVSDDGKEAYEDTDKSKNIYEDTTKQGWKPVKPKEDEAGTPVD